MSMEAIMVRAKGLFVQCCRATLFGIRSCIALALCWLQYVGGCKADKGEAELLLMYS